MSEESHPGVRFGAMQTILRCDGPQAIRASARLGFDGVELAASGPDPDDHLVWTADGRAELADLAANEGVELPSLALNFLNFGNVSDEDGAVRERAAESIRRAITAAADLGVSVILVPFFADAEIESEADGDRVVEEVGALAGDAEDAGVTLGLENTLSAEENRELLAAIGSPAVEIYYDVSNATWWGHDPVEEIRRFGGDIAQIHFKDGDDGHSDAPLGAGHVDYEGVRDSLRAVGYDGWVVLESVVDDDPEADAAKNLAFARDLMNE
jgi:sugar phosphate isomerase/epimerase